MTDDTPDYEAIQRAINDVAMNPVTQRLGEPDAAILHVTHQGVLRLSGAEIRVYQLSDGSRVFDADDVERFFGFSTGDEGK